MPGVANLVDGNRNKQAGGIAGCSFVSLIQPATILTPVNCSADVAQMRFGCNSGLIHRRCTAIPRYEKLIQKQHDRKRTHDNRNATGNTP
jgi:hypothetical protein